MPARKPGRPAATAAKTPAKRSKATAAAKPKQAAASAAAPKLSKDELRSRVEALERTNAALRAKNRDANRTAKYRPYFQAKRDLESLQKIRDALYLKILEQEYGVAVSKENSKE